MLLIHFTNDPASGDELYGYISSIKLIDDYIIIPVAMGSLISGLLISILTNWGFFKFRWVTVKWIATIVFILFGTFWLGPWVNGMEHIVKTERIAALQNEIYLYNRQMNTFFGCIQASSLIVLLFISVLKPWKKKKPTRN